MKCMHCGKFVGRAPDGSIAMHSQHDGQVCVGTNEIQFRAESMTVGSANVGSVVVQMGEPEPVIRHRGQPLAREYDRRSGFTLIELLVVLTIVIIVSAVALPTVLPALSHRQVSEAARVLQGALAGARDAAIRDNAPAGLRLLPDPAFPIQYLPNSSIDPTKPLVYNRMVPVSPAPNYTTGVVAIWGNASDYTETDGTVTNVPAGANGKVLVLEAVTGTAIEPTSWEWNIRVGDRIQLNNAGPWYTVVGPTDQGPAAGNPEQFVNATSHPTRFPASKNPVKLSGEYLYLVDGRDNNLDGFVDNGWDGVTTSFETEQWHTPIAAGTPLKSYTIARRPVPTIGAREIALPSNVVIDATSWSYPVASATTSPSMERSRLPVNPNSGYVEFLVNPDGTVVPTPIYSSPSSFGLAQAFFHFWLAERSDIAPPDTTQTGTPFLPLPVGVAPSRFNGLEIKGECRLVTLFTRSGQITTSDNVPFDGADVGNTAAPLYNANLPYLQAQQGISQGQ